MLRSSICSQADVESPAFRRWNERAGYHGATFLAWEIGFICEALYERGMLRPGKLGLGFAVGRERFPSLFASLGCEIVATDQDEVAARLVGWTEQHAARASDLNTHGLCDAERFERLVRFRVVDANAIPDDLRDFDFCWSTCAFEHFGSIENGRRFIREMERCLKPDGVAVHTTALNLCSNDETLDNNPGTVLYRQRDLEAMADDMREVGRDVDLDLTLGTRPEDLHVSRPPHAEPVMKMTLGEYVLAVVGLLIEPQGSAVGRPRSGYSVAEEWLRLSPESRR